MYSHYHKTIIKYYYFLYWGIFKASFPFITNTQEEILWFCNLNDQGLASFSSELPDRKGFWLYRPYDCNCSTLSQLLENSSYRYTLMGMAVFL